MTPSQLRVFVSSKMQELAPERLTIKSALEELQVDAWVFEQDAGARPQSIQQTYLKEIEDADLYIGLFWKGYGDYTIEEYEHARKLGKDCLIYEKRSALNDDRDPRLQTFLDQLGKVETGRTVRWFNTTDKLGDYVKHDVARWQTEIIRRHKVSGAPLTYQNPPLAEDKDRKELLILLDKVKGFWINGVLEQSIHSQVLIELGKKKMIEAVEHPWETVLELPENTYSTSVTNKRITDIFEDTGRFLLVLGEPGSGKTITILELARDLIAQAETDHSKPIPTVFNLSSWGDTKQPLMDWLAEELKAKYQIPKKIGKSWLEQHYLLPLLDGLDEVRPNQQTHCVNAINDFVQEYSSGVVVCSRLHEYTSLPVRLKLNGAVCLQPLSTEQAGEYLKKAGAELAGLRDLLKRDQNLQELTRTPLMLSIMSLAYRDHQSTDPVSSSIDTLEVRRRQVFDKYIAYMFRRKGKQNKPFSDVEVKRWVIWLAKRMEQHSQTIFLIEQLQPSWLQTRYQLWMYVMFSRFLVSLTLGQLWGWLVWDTSLGRDTAGGVVGGLMFGIVGGSIAVASVFYKARNVTDIRIKKDAGIMILVLTVLMYVIAEGTAGILMGGFYENFISNAGPTEILFADAMDIGMNGLILGLILGLIFELRGWQQGISSDIQTVETLTWNWRGAKKGIFRGFLIGICWTLIMIIFLFPQIGMDFFVPLSVVAWAFLFGTIGALFGMILGGLEKGISEKKNLPNQGIKLSIRNTVIGSSVLGLATFASVILILLVNDGNRSDVPLGYAVFFGILFGVATMLPSGLLYGGLDIIKHYLLRCILSFTGYTPYNYQRFLDYAARLLFLQKVGGGYIFIHRLLLEHFAAMNIVDEVRPVE